MNRLLDHDPLPAEADFSPENQAVAEELLDTSTPEPYDVGMVEFADQLAKEAIETARMNFMQMGMDPDKVASMSEDEVFANESTRDYFAQLLESQVPSQEGLSEEEANARAWALNDIWNIAHHIIEDPQLVARYHERPEGAVEPTGEAFQGDDQEVATEETTKAEQSSPVESKEPAVPKHESDASREQFLENLAKEKKLVDLLALDALYAYGFTRDDIKATRYEAESIGLYDKNGKKSKQQLSGRIEGLASRLFESKYTLSDDADLLDAASYGAKKNLFVSNATHLVRIGHKRFDAYSLYTPEKVTELLSESSTTPKDPIENVSDENAKSETKETKLSWVGTGLQADGKYNTYIPPALQERVEQAKLRAAASAEHLKESKDDEVDITQFKLDHPLLVRDEVQDIRQRFLAEEDKLSTEDKDASNVRRRLYSFLANEEGYVYLKDQMDEQEKKDVMSARRLASSMVLLNEGKFDELMDMWERHEKDAAKNQPEKESSSEGRTTKKRSREKRGGAERIKRSLWSIRAIGASAMISAGLLYGQFTLRDRR